MVRKGRISREKKLMIKTFADLGASYREIQRATDVSLGTISKVIREFESNKSLIEFYKKNRADLLALDQATYRSYITPEKLEKASARDLEIMRGIAHDHERLERGESTENVAVIHQALVDLQKRRAKGEA